LLKHEVGKDDVMPTTGFFGWFNRFFAATVKRYIGATRRMLGKPGRWLVLYAAILAATGWFFTKLPGSFLPSEDQGYFLSIVQLPAGATRERSLEVLESVEKHYLAQKEVAHVIGVLGFSFFGRGQNAAITFVRLKSWDERPDKENSAESVVQRANMAFFRIKQAMIFAINVPPIPELAAVGGFDFRLQDRGGLGRDKLLEARNMALGLAGQNPALAGVRPEGQEAGPQVYLTVDRVKARALGIDLGDLNDTLQATLGTAYINDFVREGRILRVQMQAEADTRRTPEDLLRLPVKNARGDMIPLAEIATAQWIVGSPKLDRYNGLPSMKIAGNPAPGRSTGEALRRWRTSPPSCRPGIGFEWSGSSYEERLSGTQAPFLFAVSLVVVFLCLAALYESWSIPFAVMLVVPLGIFGAVLAVHLRGLPNDVYFKVGLIAIIGLSAKNAILIIEFARELQEQGKDLIEATLEACRLRFRPILMTSIAFMFGVLPLAVSTGAGANSRMPSAPASSAACSPPPCWRYFWSRYFSWWCAASSPATPAITRRSMMRTKLLPLAVALALGACSFTRSISVLQRRCRRCLARRLQPAAALGDSGRVPTKLDWREYFTDPRLQALIAGRAGTQPRPAHCRRRASRKRARWLASPAPTAFPQIDLGAQRAASLTPADLSATNRQLNAQRYDVNLGVSAFELDFWGRVKSLDDAARANFLASDYAQQSFRLALVADVASAYFSAIELQERVALAAATFASRAESRRLIAARRDLGVAGDLDVLVADAAMQSTRAELANLTRQSAAADNALRLLVGSSPTLPLGKMLEQQGLVANVPVGLPAEVLLRRPDVLAAEQRLLAANANIGAARAAFLPRILLTAALGTASRSLSGLFDAGSGAWSFAPVLRYPLFDGGRSAGNSDIAEARKMWPWPTTKKPCSRASAKLPTCLPRANSTPSSSPPRTRPPRPRASASALSRRATTPACPATSNCSTRSATTLPRNSRRWRYGGLAARQYRQPVQGAGAVLRPRLTAAA
jgi:NodT family efflux transporter outer membrane factor (OMF) lipoprotein